MDSVVALLLQATADVPASGVAGDAGALLVDLPFGEAVVGALAMAGLFMWFGLQAPAEGSGGCGSCSGECGSCPLDDEECV